MTDRPALVVDATDGPAGQRGVGVHALGADAMGRVERFLQDAGEPELILRVTVAAAGQPVDGALPDVAGQYRVSAGGLHFTPHFPFQPGLVYRASFDPRPLGHPELMEVLTLTFSLPERQGGVAPGVTQIFPSADHLPENLLRFYVCFSGPMRRGNAGAEIGLLGPDGAPAEDVLYRAPTELWDGDMRCLTVLLDPGRLKRGVGPNRALGPPLKAGAVYTLVVGTGMTDLAGRALPRAVLKRFAVTAAVREPVAVERWTMAPPDAGRRQKLRLRFPRPLDWAMLPDGISIVAADGLPVAGLGTVDPGERGWRFTPDSAWSAGCYDVRVAAALEDVCGNSVTAAFDRPIRTGGDPDADGAFRRIPFRLA